MNVAMHGRITAHDVVRVEKLQGDLRALADTVEILESELRELANCKLDAAHKCVQSGARRFAKHDASEVGELQREIALARAKLQAEKWRGWWSDVERKLADVEAAFAEFRVSQQLGLALDCSSE